MNENNESIKTLYWLIECLMFIEMELCVKVKNLTEESNTNPALKQRQKTVSKLVFDMMLVLPNSV